MANIIKVASTKEQPTSAAKRKLGAFNLGLYCENEACRQFISLAPLPENPVAFKIEADPAGSGLWIVCPMCSALQNRQDEELEIVKLTEMSKQRAPIH